MQIVGEWLLCADGVERPVLRGSVRAANGSWVPAPLLVDTGADRTVFSQQILTALGLLPVASSEGIGGLGGLVSSVFVETTLRLSREDGLAVTFRGQHAAVTAPDALDMSVLGRDVTGLFATIVDPPGTLVCLLGQRHRYRIVME
jgi:hypothetical protein